DNVMHPCCRHDGQMALKAHVDKDVAWEKWQREHFNSVLPPTHTSVQREEGRESLARENLIHCFLVLVARINDMPSGERPNIISVSWHAKHTAPPCDLHEFLKNQQIPYTKRFNESFWRSAALAVSVVLSGFGPAAKLYFLLTMEEPSVTRSEERRVGKEFVKWW